MAAVEAAAVKVPSNKSLIRFPQTPPALIRERASERQETDASLAERMVREALAKARWREIDLATQPKGHRLKVRIAQLLSRQTPMSRQWVSAGKTDIASDAATAIREV
jgi:hypothetical protein